MTVTEARDNLSDILDRVSDGERIVLKRRGKSVAAIVHIEDLETIERWENEGGKKHA